MKISKLFHWLYAILMLLPFLVFLPNAFYYGFNEHAVAQEKTEQVPIYYDSNEVTQVSDLIVNNAYYWNDNYTPDNLGWSRIGSVYNNYYLEQLTNNNTDYFYIDINNGIIFFTPNGGGSGSGINLSNTPYPFVLRSFDTNNVYASNYILHITPYYNLVKEYQPLTTNMSITDSMSYAWDSVWQNDLFSWSYGSFLTEPFIYIGNVFNVPVDNSLYYALSYWLDISIIWLCFDVIMYVPLLVHRWLDKGIVE